MDLYTQDCVSNWSKFILYYLNLTNRFFRYHGKIAYFRSHNSMRTWVSTGWTAQYKSLVRLILRFIRTKSNAQTYAMRQVCPFQATLCGSMDPMRQAHFPIFEFFVQKWRTFFVWTKTLLQTTENTQISRHRDAVYEGLLPSSERNIDWYLER